MLHAVALLVGVVLMVASCGDSANTESDPDDAAIGGSGASNAGAGGSSSVTGGANAGGAETGARAPIDASTGDGNEDAAAGGTAGIGTDASAGGSGDADATATGGTASVDASAGGTGGGGTGGTGGVGEADASDADARALPPDAGDDGAARADAAAAVYFPGSVLVDAAQGAMLNGWVGTPEHLWTLCYSTDLHARSGVTFHDNCAYEGASVSIARVSYQGGPERVIGGYNSGSWTTPASGTYSSFAGSFLFSVTNAFKHDFPGAQGSSLHYIYQNSFYGPTFGAGADWYVHSQIISGTCRPGYTYQCRVGALDSVECNQDFCGTPSGSEFYDLHVLEVWIY